MLYTTIALIVFADQISKYIFTRMLDGKSVNILGDFVQFQLVNNSGIAFSLPIAPILLKVLTGVFIAGIFLYYSRFEKLPRTRWLDFAYGSILGGAISNAIERLFIGHVVDFLSIKYFAIFNIADIFITIGACILFVLYFSHERRNERND